MKLYHISQNEASLISLSMYRAKSFMKGQVGCSTSGTKFAPGAGPTAGDVGVYRSYDLMEVREYNTFTSLHLVTLKRPRRERTSKPCSHALQGSCQRRYRSSLSQRMDCTCLISGTQRSLLLSSSSAHQGSSFTEFSIIRQSVIY